MWAGDVAPKDMTAGVGESRAVGESVREGKASASSVTGAVLHRSGCNL